MKKITYFLILMAVVFTVVPSQAQFKDWGTKFGLRGNILFPENDFANLGFSGNDNFSFDWFEFSYLGEAFFAFELSPSFELQLTGGYGKYKGKAMFEEGTDYGIYETSIVPLHLRFRVSPWDLKGWNPYFYIGGGVVNYSIDTYPNIASPKSVKHNDWVAFAPIGIGAEFALAERVLFDFSIGGAITSSYDIDGYRIEDNNFWDSYFNVGLGLTFTGENCKADKDMDKLGKCEEEKLGTNPNNADTDNDKLLDGEEVLVYYTNPLNADTDADQLTDYDEIMVYKTSPLKADSDEDKLSDYDEIMVYKTNPLVADTDLDKLTDYDEVMVYKTNPLKADTDEDGLTDYEEITVYKTNPLKADTDEDELMDAEEVIKYKTNPNSKDTDLGTIDDYTEIVRGTNPLVEEDDIIVIGVPIVLEGITFDVNKATIRPESEPTLMKALKTLQTYSDISVEIDGYTDSDGSARSNQILSEQRADAVKNWLISKGIEAGRISAVGFGEENPIADNTTKEGKAKNRRIEFKRVK